MTVLQIKNLSINFSGNPILTDVSATLGAGDRVGIVGPNGSGKTTLIRAVMGETQPDGGSVDWVKRPRVGYVPQRWDPPLGLTPMQLVGYEHAAMLGRSGIGRPAWDRPCSDLSGGERTRLLLARAFSNNPEALVMDEPTNHLDIAGIEWLEKTIRGFSGAVVVVSHDRFFLDSVATRIWELRDGRLAAFSGGYSAYRERLREQQANETKEYAKWQRRIRELATEISNRRQWYEKAHDDAGKNDFLRRKAKKHARQFLAKERMLEKTVAAKPDVRRPDVAVKVTVDHAGHRTRTILRASELGFWFDGGRRLLDRVAVSLGPHDKVGLIGPNGSGKTTLLRVLLGELHPREGTVWVNPAARIGYLTQMLDDLDLERSTVDNVRDRTGLLPAEARNLLGRMGITGDTQLQSLNTLSMGERTRVAISCLCFGRYDVLVLDEPTNHLDANARDCVEQALSSFPGALTIATHDRYFLDSVCNVIWSIEGGKVRTFKGNYSEFRDEGAREGSDLSAADAAARELAIQAEMAYLVSKISVERDTSAKADLETRYGAALEKLREIREKKAREV